MHQVSRVGEAKEVSLTIAYITNRKEPKFEWFRDTLARQCIEEGFAPNRLIVVDHWQSERADDPRFKFNLIETYHVSPKPHVWNGPFKLTKHDYFAAANARNTAICFTETTHLAYIDDLSVLMPGWLRSVRECVEAKDQVRLGSYLKANKILVHDGRAISWEQTSLDSRWHQAKTDQWSCAGSWLFGCSVCFPVQALLDVNGWDENCDSTGLGSEDYVLGIRIGQLGRYSFLYDRGMQTMESEEHHKHPDGGEFLRMDKGVSPRDKSHSILAQCIGNSWAPNYFGPGGIAELRNRVLSGEPFPIQQIPQHDWYDGQPLSEL